ncbi:MAG: hypothetical protein ACLFTT_05210 [Candidatus Hydrogenedentota bacterium]
MKHPSPEEQKRLVKLWEETGRALDRMRREKLAGKRYDWKEVDELLSLGDIFPQPSRTSSGLVEMQYWFMRAKKKQG